MINKTGIESGFDKAAAMKSLGSERLLRKVARLFLENAPNLLTNVSNAIDDQNAEQLEHSAHKLVSSMAYLAGNATRSAAIELERMGRNGDMQNASEGYTRLAKDLTSLITAIELMLQEEEQPRES